MSENGKLSKFWVQELTRPAFADWLENEQAPVVIIGIGAIEQHGLHLPLGTDSLGVAKFIHEVASHTNSVCIHPCWPGYSPHHMSFPGTVTFSSETLLGVLMDTIGSFAYHGVKRFIMVNYHGGNEQTFQLAIQKARSKYKVMIAAPTGPKNTELAKEIQDRMARYLEVHSGPRETSFALHYFPELCEMWRAEDWENGLVLSKELQEFMDPDREDYELVSQIFYASFGPMTEDITRNGQYASSDPRKGNAEEGAAMMKEAVDFMVDFIELWKSLPLPPAYRD
ncbi:creatininase family protein [archaeon]|nr:creatininase family protein [archaeon]